MKKTLITLLAMGGWTLGATETFDTTYIKAAITINIDVQAFKNIAGSNINTPDEVLPLFVFTGGWSNGTNVLEENTGSLGIANNGSGGSKSSFWGYWTKGTGSKTNQNHDIPDSLFNSNTDWGAIESITLTFTYDSTLVDNGVSNSKTVSATEVTTGVTITYNDDTTTYQVSKTLSPYCWTTWNEGRTELVDNVYQFHATGLEVNDTYVSSYTFAGLKSIPEPATATLSLLALAGLCARRRRK